MAEIVGWTCVGMVFCFFLFAGLEGLSWWLRKPYDWEKRGR